MLLEYALPIPEFALRIVEGANLAAVVEPDFDHALIDGSPVRAGIPIHRGSYPSGNSRHRMNACQTIRDREIDERLQNGARFGMDFISAPLDAVAAISQDDSPVPFIRDNEVGAASQNHEIAAA